MSPLPMLTLPAGHAEGGDPELPLFLPSGKAVLLRGDLMPHPASLSPIPL